MNINANTAPFDIRVRTKVFLNDKYLEECLEADDEKNYVIRYMRDAENKKVIVNDKWQTERVEGKVTIIIEDE